jgi:Fe-S-cluster containining protein
MKKNYLNVELCKKCGGKCCKRFPGIAYPEDFKKPLKDSLLKAFTSGNWAIDWYEGDPTGKDELSKAFFIRPKIKDVKELFDPSWGGECIFLTKDGCILNPNERPKGCRMLESISLKNCILHAAKDKKDAAMAWLPYTKMILDITEIMGESQDQAHIYETPNFLDTFWKYHQY